MPFLILLGMTAVCFGAVLKDNPPRNKEPRPLTLEESEERLRLIIGKSQKEARQIISAWDAQHGR